MLMLDEPTLAVSVKETAKVFALIRIAKSKGLAVTEILDNLNQTRHVADHFVVFRHRKKVGDIPTQAGCGGACPSHLEGQAR
jgi:ABC-type sugar transport system ATPase subunit